MGSGELLGRVMSLLDDLVFVEQSEEVAWRCVVRLSTSAWSDKRGLHFKQSLTYLRRKSCGWNPLEDEADGAGALRAYEAIINLAECKDGLYEVFTCNHSRDWETGIFDGYDLKLVPFECAE